LKKERKLTMNTMHSKALPELTTGLLNQLIVNLGGQDGGRWEKELELFLSKKPCWTKGQVTQVAKPKLKPKPLILEFVSTVIIPATTDRFLAIREFVVTTKGNATVNINHIGEKFMRCFLSGAGKTENPISKQTLRYAKLRKTSVDGPIIEELGGKAKAETTLSEMFYLMEKQKHGEYGALLNNGYANLFYIRDNAGVLRAVRVSWDSCGGWRVSAPSVEDPFGWRVGGRVFSRNSVLESSETSAPAQA